eukprot:EG_transcript_27192
MAGPRLPLPARGVLVAVLLCGAAVGDAVRLRPAEGGPDDCLELRGHDEVAVARCAADPVFRQEWSYRPDLGTFTAGSLCLGGGPDGKSAADFSLSLCKPERAEAQRFDCQDSRCCNRNGRCVLLTPSVPFRPLVPGPPPPLPASMVHPPVPLLALAGGFLLLAGAALVASARQQCCGFGPRGAAAAAQTQPLQPTPMAPAGWAAPPREDRPPGHAMYSANL